ncbi:LPXTG cell wall anchor domain-containing protein [Corynebacterium sp. p3-SID1056]|uniref:LPXTG cell wall anchor domain-containing protein n=1 Tax=Corynebacterium sp. p3-SID1056 TaxID=2916092 RepID=UPI0021A52B71|nr:LPXTG cell wall anchor domain-containing protein [Corynebacterium sp. p3-SID1056]MCT2338060.1 LPXTG cell wall anchor domain-containing protein [Corynebacterium sp. p3-SID1056]
MTLRKHTGKLSCVALAAAVAGTFAITPVATAQQPSLLSQLADLAPKTAPEDPAGTGSYAAHFASAGWAYTALALNPVNDRVYALSKGEAGKPAGHLLRIHPVTGELRDLGKVLVDGALDPSTTSAAFTSTGTLVLDAGDTLHTLDLSKDASGTPFDGPLKFASQDLAVNGKTDAELPHAWGSVSGADADTLYAVSAGTTEDAPYLWALDVESGRMSAEPLKVARGVDASKLGEMNYAYTNRAGNLVFADDRANTVEVKDVDTNPLLVAAAKGKRITENYLNLAGLRAGSWYRPSSQPQTTSAEAKTPAAEPSEAKEPATPKAQTKLTEPTEPTSQTEPSTKQAPAAPVEATETPEDTATSAAATPRDVLVTVADEDGRAVRDYDVIVDEDPSIYAKTDREGQARLSLPAELGDVQVAAGGELHPVSAGETTLRVQFHADEADAPEKDAADTPTEKTADEDADTATNKSETATPKSETPEKAQLPEYKVTLTLVDDDRNPLKYVELVDQEEDEVASTNKDGEAEILIPEGTKSLSLKVAERDVPKGYQNEYFTVDRSKGTRSIRLKKETSTATDYPKKDVRITVVTEGGSPVGGAVLKADKKIIGITDADGVATAELPKGDERYVSITLEEAPEGYNNDRLVFDRSKNSGELVLSKAENKDEKTKPQQILEVMKEVEPMMKTLIGPLAALAGAGGALGGAASGGAKSTGTSTSTTSSTPGPSYSRANMTGGVSTGRSTSAKAKKSSVVKRTVSKKSGSSDSTSESSRDGDLAETGTPMTTVITLGILLLLIGGAYMYVGRRRENE